MSFMAALGGIGAAFDLGKGIYDIVTAEQNKDREERNLQYQIDTQREIFRREDTAVQRRVADMKAAGINPILAAGNGAQSGAVVSTKAPQKERVDYTPSKSMEMVGNMLRMKADIARSAMQTELLESSKDLVDLKKVGQDYENRLNRLDVLKGEVTGTNPRTASQFGRIGSDLSGALIQLGDRLTGGKFSKWILDQNKKVPPKSKPTKSYDFKTMSDPDEINKYLDELLGGD